MLALKLNAPAETVKAMPAAFRLLMSFVLVSPVLPAKTNCVPLTGAWELLQLSAVLQLTFGLSPPFQEGLTLS